MKLKFIDTNNNLQTLILDENPKTIIKENLKEGKLLYGKAYLENLDEFANKFSELDFYRNCPDYKSGKFTKSEAVMLSPNLISQYEEYLDQIIPDEDKIYVFYFEWDENAIYALNNRSNNPNVRSSMKKFVGIPAIKKLIKQSGLTFIPDEGEIIDEGVEVITIMGKKKNFQIFFNEIAKLLTEAERLYSGDKYTNYKISEVEERKLEELEPSLKEIKDKINDLELELSDNQDLIEENDAIINDPNSSEEDIELSKEDNEDLLKDQEDIKNDLSELRNKYSEGSKEVKKKIENNEYDEELLKEIFAKVDKAFEGHTYTANEVEHDYDAYGDGFQKADKYMVQGLGNVIGDSSHNWFGIKDAFLKFDFENSKLIVDNKCYNYIEVNNALIKKYKDSKIDISIEQWIEENPEATKNIINLLNPIKIKGETEKMKNDALKNVTFKFADGTTIEVLESDGKDFATVKDEAIKVYKEFKSAKDACASTKDVDLIKESEEETEEVLEEYGAKATNDSTEDETAYDNAKKAFAEGKTLKEWFAEEGKNLVDGDNDIAKKENAIEIWRAIKEEAEAENPEEEKKELSEDEQWDIAYKNMNYTDSTDTEDVKIEDEVEEAEDKYEVVVNGKQVGIFNTLEEAEEAEKKALEAVEQGIPKPTTEDCDL